MNSEHKVGDVLTLRSWRSAMNEYGSLGTLNILAAPGMAIGSSRAKECGKRHTISKVYLYSKTQRLYYYLNDVGDFPFPQEMFVEVK